MIQNIFPAEELSNLARIKKEKDDFQTVRNPLIEEEVANGWEVVKEGASKTRLKKPKLHNKYFEDRVWTLLYRMGFQHLNGEGGARLEGAADGDSKAYNQLDVFALDDEVAIVVECKSSETVESKARLTDSQAIIGKLVSMKQRIQAALRTVPSQGARQTNRQIALVLWTQNLIVSDNDKDRARESAISLLNLSELTYYEQLTDEIGAAARYQLLADLFQQKRIDGLEIKVPAIKTRIKQFDAYTFSISPAYLLKIAFVSHRSRGAVSDVGNYQRMVKRSRLRSIARYIEEGGMFPTNIVVNISPKKGDLVFDTVKQESDDTKARFGWLTIKARYRMAWIIDGQHRLLGYAQTERANNQTVTVFAFVGADESLQANLFIDINAKQKKVSPSLLQELYADLHWDSDDPEARAGGIISRAIQELDSNLESPLFGRIKKTGDKTTPTRRVTFAALFSAMSKARLLIQEARKSDVHWGPLWANDQWDSLKRVTRGLTAYFAAIQAKAQDIWRLGGEPGGGLVMNDGITVCILVLKSLVADLEARQRISVRLLSLTELENQFKEFGDLVGDYFATRTSAEMLSFRRLRGAQGHDRGVKLIQVHIFKKDPGFDAVGLKKYIADEESGRDSNAMTLFRNIEKTLQKLVLTVIKTFAMELPEYRDQADPRKKEEVWFFHGVPEAIREFVEKERNKNKGSKDREQCFHFIHYRAIAEQHPELFSMLWRAHSKKERSLWMERCNKIRNDYLYHPSGAPHPIPIEEFVFLEEIDSWLTQVSREYFSDSSPSMESFEDEE